MAADVNIHRGPGDGRGNRFVLQVDDTRVEISSPDPAVFARIVGELLGAEGSWAREEFEISMARPTAAGVEARVLLEAFLRGPSSQS